jgi:predicted ATP-grasp superfamily ATP-dependent carboligase
VTDRLVIPGALRNDASFDIASEKVLPADPPGSSGTRSQRPDERSHAVPAIIVGSGLTALGVLRLLHRDSIPAYCLSSSPSIEAQSRWYRPLPLECKAAGSTTGLEEALRACALPRAVLIPCSDHAVNAVAALTAALAARFPSSVAPRETVARLTDKAQFATLLEQLSIPRPLTMLVDAPSDIDAVADSAFDGAFLKPRDSISFYARYQCKAFRVASRADAAGRLARLQADGIGAILQEFIPGPGSNHYLIDGFADAQGRVRTLFARQRLRIHPPEFGNSSYMVSVPLASVGEAAASLKTIIAALHFRGIFSAEFKFDERDRSFKILEINARAWWYVEFAGRCGVDVCRMAYADALGQEVPEQWNYRVGARLVYGYMDLMAGHHEWRAGRLSLAAWARSWLGAQQPDFNWTDPMPALREWGGHLRNVLARPLQIPSGHS